MIALNTFVQISISKYKKKKRKSRQQYFQDELETD